MCGIREDDMGRRNVDYKPPTLFTWETTLQFLFLVVSGIVLLVLTGCTVIKKGLGG